MKTLMSVAIAVAFKMLVMPVMVAVSAEAQDPADLVARSIQNADLFARGIQNAGIQVVALVQAGVNITDVLEDFDPPEITVICIDGGACFRLAVALTAAGFDCAIVGEIGSFVYVCTG